jgi:hypothetical protein
MKSFFEAEIEAIHVTEKYVSFLLELIGINIWISVTDGQNANELFDQWISKQA